MKILGIIPARAGSKGLKDKNILKLNKKPLIAWSILAAKKSKVLSKVIVSTDSLKISRIAKKYGAEVPFMRPAKYSGDKAKSSELIIHALNFFIKKKIHFDYVVLIEPTSPLREAGDIRKCISLIKKNEIDTLVSVSKVKSPHPRFIYKFSSEFKIKPYISSKKNLSARRQDVESLYFLEGTIYCSNVKTFLRKKTFYHNNTSAFVVPKWKSIEIDSLFDLKLSEFIMKNKKKYKNG